MSTPKINKALPVFKAVVSLDAASETGIQFVSLVSTPAIEESWHAFSKHVIEQTFKQVGSADQQKLAGPFMVPDMLIYRKDEQYGEYYITFDSATIQTMADKFNASAGAKNINVEHSEPINAYITENWVIDNPSKDKSSSFGYKLPVGTWFGVVKVQDKAFWDEFVKTGTLTGFSIEGMLGMAQIKMNQQTNNMKAKFAELKTKDGQQLITSDAKLIVGSELYMIDKKSGTQVPYPDGNVTLESGEEVKIIGGKVADIVPAVPVATPAATPATDAPVTPVAEAKAPVAPPVEGSPAEEKTETPAVESVEDPGLTDEHLAALEEFVNIMKKKNAAKAPAMPPAAMPQHDPLPADGQKLGATGFSGPVGPIGISGQGISGHAAKIADLEFQLKALQIKLSTTPGAVPTSAFNDETSSLDRFGMRKEKVDSLTETVEKISRFSRA